MRSRGRICMRLGKALRVLGLTGASAALCRRAIKRAPLSVEARFELGEALLAGEHWAAASEAFSQAVRLKPDDQEARGNLAIALAKQGRVRDTIEVLEGLA